MDQWRISRRDEQVEVQKKKVIARGAKQKVAADWWDLNFLSECEVF
jgi:hypothetical protein